MLDIYQYVYRCGHQPCGDLFFGVRPNSKADFVRKVGDLALRSPDSLPQIKNHWIQPLVGQQTHKEVTGKEYVFHRLVEDYTLVEEQDQEAMSGDIKEVRMIGETRVIKVPSKLTRTPTKEAWKVVAQEFSKEQEVSWKCNQASCTYIGATSCTKMQLHLSCHGLAAEEVQELAGDEARMAACLPEARRTVYKSKGVVVGWGPQVYVASQQVVVGQEHHCCRAEEECSMTFAKEQELLKHCRSVHPTALSSPAPPTPLTPQKLELGGEAYRCLQCRALVLAAPGSGTLSEHWALHQPQPYTDMRFLAMATSQVLGLQDIHPFSALCGHSPCSLLLHSSSSLDHVQQLLLSHWKQARHPGSAQLTALSHQITSSPVKAQGTAAVEVTGGLDALQLQGPFQCCTCLKEVANAQSVFQHSSEQHPAVPLPELQVEIPEKCSCYV